MDVGGTELSMSRIIRAAVNWICEGFLEDRSVENSLNVGR